MQAPAVILCNPKYAHNVAGVLRSCSCFAIPSLRWTGTRVRIDADLGERLPREERMKGYRDVEWMRSEKPFDELPPGCQVVAIELVENSESLTAFDHYCVDGHGYDVGNVAYVFGPEDGSISQAARRHCFRFVHIPAHHCLNLSAAVNVVLADRMMKLQRAGVKPILPLSEMLHENRGYIDVPGWDGK